MAKSGMHKGNAATRKVAIAVAQMMADAAKKRIFDGDAGRIVVVGSNTDAVREFIDMVLDGWSSEIRTTIVGDRLKNRNGDNIITISYPSTEKASEWLKIARRMEPDILVAPMLYHLADVRTLVSMFNTKSFPIIAGIRSENVEENIFATMEHAVGKEDIACVFRTGDMFISLDDDEDPKIMSIYKVDHCGTLGFDYVLHRISMDEYLEKEQQETENMDCIQNFTVTEVCPHCESKVTLVWDIDVDGYTIYCPNCGKLFHLCNACRHSPDYKGCDWDGECSYGDNIGTSRRVDTQKTRS